MLFLPFQHERVITMVKLCKCVAFTVIVNVDCFVLCMIIKDKLFQFDVYITIIIKLYKFITGHFLYLYLMHNVNG